MLLWMRQKRVLIVEDDADLRRMFRTSLALAGYVVEEAGDGIDALRIVDDRLPDLIVLDLVLQFLDGISVQQELAARALTCPDPHRHRHRLDDRHPRPAGGLRAQKPVMPDELVRTVQQCMVHGAPASGA